MIKLHLGCGKRDFGKDWYHIDAEAYGHIVSQDVKNLTHHPDQTVDVIYASHLIAYFDKVEVVKVLKEWNRVLKPGGILRIATPDFIKLMWVYQNTADINNILGPLYGRMEMNGGYIYHKTCYTFKSLTAVLEEAGFDNVRIYNWRETDHAQFDDHSQAYFPHMDKDNGTLISLNVECDA